MARIMLLPSARVNTITTTGEKKSTRRANKLPPLFFLFSLRVLVCHPESYFSAKKCIYAYWIFNAPGGAPYEDSNRTESNGKKRNQPTVWEKNTRFGTSSQKIRSAGKCDGEVSAGRKRFRLSFPQQRFPFFSPWRCFATLWRREWWSSYAMFHEHFV